MRKLTADLTNSPWLYFPVYVSSSTSLDNPLWAESDKPLPPPEHPCPEVIVTSPGEVRVYVKGGDASPYARCIRVRDTEGNVHEQFYDLPGLPALECADAIALANHRPDRRRAARWLCASRSDGDAPTERYAHPGANAHPTTGGVVRRGRFQRRCALRRPVQRYLPGRRDRVALGFW